MQTAIDAAKAGFDTYVIEEAQRCVSTEAWSDAKGDFEKAKVHIVSIDGDEVNRVKAI